MQKKSIYDTILTYLTILPINSSLLKKNLQQQRKVVVVGAYGTGKTLVADWISQTNIKKGNLVIDISLKNLHQPTLSNFIELTGQDNLIDWSNYLHTKVYDTKAQKRQLIILIREAQALSKDNAVLWEILYDINYYHKNVELIITGTPSLLARQHHIFNRIKTNSLIYTRPLSVEESKQVIQEYENRDKFPINQYAKQITKFAGGHYGNIKHICQMLIENKFIGKRITNRQLISWAQNRGDLPYFFTQVWTGLSPNQQTVIRKCFVDQNLKNHEQKIVQQLTKTGILRISKKQIKWRISWLESEIEQFVKNTFNDDAIDLTDLNSLGKKERLLINQLIANKNHALSYDQLSEKIHEDMCLELSDWSISQLVSRVRKKLLVTGKTHHLQTVRGVGFKWVE